MYVRKPIPERLEKKLADVKGYTGEYEYEHDFEKVYKKLLGTHPFSVLVFYENAYTKMNKKQCKRVQKENPNFPGRMLFGSAFYEQFYFTPELEESRVGTYLGSGYRSTQSTYALALSMLSKTIDIPTDIVIIDENNSPRHIKYSKKLIVQPQEVTQNVSLELAEEMLGNTIKAYSIPRDQKIKCIMIDKP